MGMRSPHFQGFFDEFIELRGNLGVAHPWRDERVIALLVELVDAREGLARLRVFAVLAAVPLARV
jgi:hypothetical protein